MTLTVVLGFAIIAGILAGYITARKAPMWAILVLWILCALSIMGYAAFLDTGTGRGAMQSAVVLYGVLIPFSISVLLSSLIGVVVRMIFARRDAV